MRRSAVTALLALLLVPATAAAAWREPDGGAGSLNHVAADLGRDQSLAAVAGVPYVAWAEGKVGGFAVRVRRLNSSGTGWEDVGGGLVSSPGTPTADHPSIADVGGVPYTAWREYDGRYHHIRVSRLDAAATGWEAVGGPIGHATNHSANDPSLASVGGVPYVAWRESDGTNLELRVSRMNSSGTGWDEVGSGANPINHAPDRDARMPSLADVGGVPYVAWYERDATAQRIRVSRVDASGTAWQEVGGPVGAAGTNAFLPSLASIG